MSATKIKQFVARIHDGLRDINRQPPRYNMATKIQRRACTCTCAFVFVCVARCEQCPGQSASEWQYMHSTYRHQSYRTKSEFCLDIQVIETFLHDFRSPLASWHGRNHTDIGQGWL